MSIGHDCILDIRTAVCSGNMILTFMTEEQEKKKKLIFIAYWLIINELSDAVAIEQ